MHPHYITPATAACAQRWNGLIRTFCNATKFTVDRRLDQFNKFNELPLEGVFDCIIPHTFNAHAVLVYTCVCYAWLFTGKRIQNQQKHK